MFRHFRKSLAPLRSKLVKFWNEHINSQENCYLAAVFCKMETRAVGGAGNEEGGVRSPTAFERNCESKEQQLSTALKRSMPGITYISVEDISGGCGAMFEISVEAKEFIGLSRVKQHRLVTNSLKEEIAEMHGIRIHTTPAPSEKN